MPQPASEIVVRIPAVKALGLLGGATDEATTPGIDPARVECLPRDSSPFGGTVVPAIADHFQSKRLSEYFVLLCVGHVVGTRLPVKLLDMVTDIVFLAERERKGQKSHIRQAKIGKLYATPVSLVFCYPNHIYANTSQNLSDLAKLPHFTPAPPTITSLVNLSDEQIQDLHRFLQSKIPGHPSPVIISRDAPATRDEVVDIFTSSSLKGKYMSSRPLEVAFLIDCIAGISEVVYASRLPENDLVVDHEAIYQDSDISLSKIQGSYDDINTCNRKMWQNIAHEGGVGTTSLSRAEIMNIIPKYTYERLASYGTLVELNQGVIEEGTFSITIDPLPEGGLL